MKMNAQSGWGAGAQPGGRRALVGMLVAMGLGVTGMVFADPISVPNGDFSDPGNTGTVGGGVVGGSANDVLIGSGPWLGTYRGLLGLLAPPTLAINHNTQTATITGIGVNLLGLGNGGYFTQTLGQNWQTGRFYVFGADVDAGTLLNLDLLGSSGVGIALRAGNTEVASSSDPLSLLDLDLVGGTLQRVRIGYFAEPGVNGAINLKLGYEPQGVAAVDLFPVVTFRNVSLEVRDIGAPTAVEILTFSDMLQAEVNQPFAGKMVALVRDEDGDGIPGHAVTFTAPATGASATVSAGGSSGTSITVYTDLDGLAVVGAHANAVAGCYRVTVQAEDIPDTSEFHLRNYSFDTGQDSVFCNGYQ